MLAASPASRSNPQRAQPGAQVLSRIAAPRPCRGNPLRGPAAPGSRLLTLPSILRPGFRSLSAPNNTSLAKHLPQADRAPAGGLAWATRSRSTFPAIVRRGSAALGDKRQQRSSPQESQCSGPQHALRTTSSQPPLGEGGEWGGTLGATVLKGPMKCSQRGKNPNTSMDAVHRPPRWNCPSAACSRNLGGVHRTGQKVQPNKSPSRA